MGGLAVLEPQDCLRDRHQTLANSHMKTHRNPNPNSTKSNRRRKRSPGKKNDGKTDGESRHTIADNMPVKSLIMGQVKILKRGEDLTALKGVDEKKTGDSDDLTLSSTERLGPEPEMVPKQTRLGEFYAGLPCIESPPPSSLPLPGFFSKKSGMSKNNDASTDLRRLLGLDFL